MVRTFALVAVCFATASTPAGVHAVEASSRAGSTAATAVSSGSRHACALTAEGSVLCWGANGSGQLGDGTFSISSRPVAVKGLGAPVIAITAGGYHTCALTRPGRVLCWGWNLFGQLGNGRTSDSPVAVSVRGLAGRAVEIGAGGGQTCALMRAGTVECWGGNAFGQLGDGTVVQHNTPVRVLGLGGRVKTISVGGRHACALMRGGEVRCWGANYWGQLGDGTVRLRSRAVRVRGLPGKAIAISAGRFYTCAVLRTGAVDCWGSNFFRQLGTGRHGYTTKPVRAAFFSGKAVTVSAGARHTCVLTDANEVECWGSNNSGQLGGDSSGETSPVTGIEGRVVDLSVGDYHTCVLTVEGTVQCWGSNFFGQLGVGTRFASSAPLTASGLSEEATAVTAGEDHTCALLRSGKLECWGWNAFGQLGDGTSTDRSSAAATVPLDGTPSVVDAGGRHTCALFELPADGSDVSCWGANAHGQLGDGGTQPARQPHPVSGLAGAASISAGNEHTCAVLRSGVVSCWGANGYGQLGDGALQNRTTPVEVGGLVDATAVSAGGYHTCALTRGGAIECWGANYRGQLGDGSVRPSSVPVAATGLPDPAEAVAAGGDHTCALTIAGDVWCWGADDSGQLGNGVRADSPVVLPVQVKSLEGRAVAVASGARHSCALLDSGAVACWGQNAHGQLGNGTTSPSPSPVTVTSLPGPAVAIAAGENHTCAALRSGDIECWGWNFFGQLADGTAPASGTATPMPVVGLG